MKNKYLVLITCLASYVLLYLIGYYMFLAIKDGSMDTSFITYKATYPYYLAAVAVNGVLFFLRKSHGVFYQLFWLYVNVAITLQNLISIFLPIGTTMMATMGLTLIASVLFITQYCKKYRASDEGKNYRPKYIGVIVLAYILELLAILFQYIYTLITA